MEQTVCLHHFAMSVGDLQESVSWYEEMFGLHVINEIIFPHNGAHMVFIGNSDFVIELVHVPNAKPLPAGRSHPDTDNAVLGLKHYCICVDNNKAFIDRLRGKGVKIVFEVQPQGEESYAAFINDPTGNVIEIFDKKNHIADKLA